MNDLSCLVIVLKDEIDDRRAFKIAELISNIEDVKLVKPVSKDIGGHFVINVDESARFHAFEMKLRRKLDLTYDGLLKEFLSQLPKGETK